MGRLSLNREFLLRHLGVALLMAALGGWFLYDGAVAYPARGEPPQKCARQLQFSALLLLVAAGVGAHLWKVKRETLVWDEREMNGSLTQGRPAAFADVREIRDARWARDGILVVVMADGRRIRLDAWHHPEVNELVKKLKN